MQLFQRQLLELLPPVQRLAARALQRPLHEIVDRPFQLQQPFRRHGVPPTPSGDPLKRFLRVATMVPASESPTQGGVGLFPTKGRQFAQFWQGVVRSGLSRKAVEPIAQEDIPVPGGAQFPQQGRNGPGGRRDGLGGDQGFEQTQAGAQSPQTHAHLMHAFNVLGLQDRPLVGEGVSRAFRKETRKDLLRRFAAKDPPALLKHGGRLFHGISRIGAGSRTDPQLEELRRSGQLTLISSISKMSVAAGGIEGGRPWAP